MPDLEQSASFLRIFTIALAAAVLAIWLFIGGWLLAAYVIDPVIHKGGFP